MTPAYDFMVRCSSLTEYPDCERRFASRHLQELIGGAGFAMREVAGQIGAKVGTAVHSGAAHMLRHKMKHGDTGNGADAIEQGIESLRDEMRNGTVLDDTTPTIGDAEKQVSRMVKAYQMFIAPRIQPVAVELELTARVTKTLRLTGHMDVAENEEIRDTKTGIHQRPNHPQYGGYSLLRRAHGSVVTKFHEDYVPRGAMAKPQREPKTTEYPVATSEQATKAVLNRIDLAVQVFTKTGNPWEFLPNPASMLCSDRFCPAFNTAFCLAHKGAK